MQLKASLSAQFFVQDEYSQVAIEPQTLVISSITHHERIPFSIWNGQITLQRGICWGQLTFYAHAEQNRVMAWRVQGLPWHACKPFAEQAIQQYQDWHRQQCAQLNQRLPHWNESLKLLIKQPAYLSDSDVHVWQQRLYDDLEKMNVTLEEAQQRLPLAFEDLLPWLNDTKANLEQRNAYWLENERPNWEVLFSQLESTPLNVSQQHAVLLNNDYNLVLAGAGTGKTSVLTARVAYLLQSHLAQAEALLMLAFGRDAADEMSERLKDKIGLASDKVTVNTFHQLGLNIINSQRETPVTLSPMATDERLKKRWCSQWLREHWQQPSNLSRWQKHLSQWPIAYLKGDDELASQTENIKLIAWLVEQLDVLCLCHTSKKSLQQHLIENPDYSRLNSELALVWPCYQAWQQQLVDQQQVDFHTMITQATSLVRKGKFISPWRYIMVDEYQDISPDRLALVEALCCADASSKKSVRDRGAKGVSVGVDERVNITRKQQRASLFAVGDDWQSIYQFSGANVALTTKFASRFASSSIHQLDTTYRYNSKIGEVANQFIQQNPQQLEKSLHSHKEQKKKAVYVMPQKRIEKTLDELNQAAELTKKVLLLGRNHRHKPELLADWNKRFSNLNIQFMTCHASKGQEADWVFILGVDQGQFPAVVRQQHLNSALMTERDDFNHAEERRLFYVALTRAKRAVWVTYGATPSCFVRELQDGEYAIINKR